MNISVFGLGYVGCVSLGCLAQNGHNAIGVDTNPVKVEQINSGKATIVEKDIDEIINQQTKAGRIRATLDPEEAVLNSDISIICVGTPNSEIGHLNMNAIYKVAENISQSLKRKNSFHVIAIRSTVPPGTNEVFSEKVERISGRKRNIDFTVVSNPEFLREGSSIYDYYNPPFTLLGSDNEHAIKMMMDLYKQVQAEIVVTDIKVAEIIKFVNNSFHALKIAFANEIGNICHALKIDAQKVMDVFIRDKQLNVSAAYLKPGFAYGGSCLPKDLRGLQVMAHDLYLDVPIIENIHKSNEHQIRRIVGKILSLNKKKVGIIGLSFKKGTDDLRNSPMVILAEIFLGKGFDIKIYDKNVNYSILTGKNKEYIDTHIPHLSRLLNSNISKVIDQSDVLIVAHKEKEYVEILKDVFDKIIIDLIYLGKEISLKTNYYGANW